MGQLVRDFLLAEMEVCAPLKATQLLILLCFMQTRMDIVPCWRAKKFARMRDSFRDGSNASQRSVRTLFRVGMELRSTTNLPRGLSLASRQVGCRPQLFSWTAVTEGSRTL
ncbi:hypothetical protein Plhal304r1_c009g0037721 [Plasmopara halstedii]